MNGPEHYRVAQDLISEAGEEDQDARTTDVFLAAAQVHATLALVAVTADAASDWHGSAQKWESVVSS